MKNSVKILGILLMVLRLGSPLSVTATRNEVSSVRLTQLVEANVIAVHAYQVLLAKSSGKGDRSCFSPGSLSDAELNALSEHQTRLLKTDLSSVRAWVKGATTSFDPSQDLLPILNSSLVVSDKAPVNVFTRYLHQNTK